MNRKHLEEQLKNYERRIELYELKESQMGIHFPTPDALELESLRSKAAYIRKQLELDTNDEPDSGITLNRVSFRVSEEPSNYFIGTFKRNIVFGISILVAAIIAFVAAYFFLSQQTIKVEIPNSSLANTDTQNVTHVKITAASVKFPNIVIVQGNVTNLPKDMKLWMYVFSNDNRYYFKLVTTNSDGSWISDEIKIGDINFGEKSHPYKVGVIQASRDCRKVQPTDPIPEEDFPSCATELLVFPVYRS